MRAANWARASDDIDRCNRIKEHHMRCGHNHFSTWSKEEKRRIRGYKNPKLEDGPVSSYTGGSTDAPPPTANIIDWVNGTGTGGKVAVTAVQN